jgi:hypothetical protein
VNTSMEKPPRKVLWIAIDLIERAVVAANA